MPEALQQGLLQSYTADGHLFWFSPDGASGEARFKRESKAWTPQLDAVDYYQPRFVDGRFGQAVFIENGVGSAAILSSRNLLVPQDDLATPMTLEARTDFSIGPIPIGNRFIWSVYVRGEPGRTLAMDAETVPPTNTDSLDDLLADTSAKQVPPTRIAGSVTPLDGTWQRLALVIETAGLPPQAQDPDNLGRTYPLRFTLTPSGPVTVKCMMLENAMGYPKRSTPSSWLPGGMSRDGEILQLATLDDSPAGTLAFWVKATGRLEWRCLLAIGSDPGWSLPLRLDLRNDQRLHLVTGSGAAETAPWEPDAWHHVVVAWQDKSATLYLDGTPLPSQPLREPLTGPLILGGVMSNQSPGVRADAAFDDILFWDRALSADAIAKLAARPTSTASAVPLPLTLRDDELVAAFARDAQTRYWHLTLTNRAATSLRDAHITFRIGEHILHNADLALALPSGHSVELQLPWSPARLLTGVYIAAISIATDAQTARLSRSITIAPERPPSDQAQVITWMGAPAEARELGVTAGSLFGLAPDSIEQLVKQGLYVQTHLRYHGDSPSPDARFMDCTGERTKVDQRNPDAVRDLDAKIDQTVTQLRRLPDVRFADLNSEQLWIDAPDFRPATIDFVQQRFGLDLRRWRSCNAPINPNGRLSPSCVELTPPESGLVPADSPLLRYSRWWHTEAGTEVFLNERIAAGLSAVPRVQSLVEPALRRPSIQPFHHQNILQSWFYYSDPTSAIRTQEGLAAIARRTGAEITGMPQFLFKPGMAAPYGGMPTPHLFRETVWLCLSRPLRHLSYWNLTGAVDQGKKQTQAQIDAELGPTPDWDTACKGITINGEQSSLFLHIPELRDEIARLHKEVVRPLSELWPRWRNRPRRIAVYHSFAGEIFSTVRWQYRSPLSQQIKTLLVPYDVLYDEDFATPNPLASYDLVLIPESTAIPASAGDLLRQWGGKVIADAGFIPDLPNLQRLPAKADDVQQAMINQHADTLEKRFASRQHPQFIEGMEQFIEQLNSGERASWLQQVVHDQVTPEATTDSLSVYLNSLEAAGANYLVAVNNLRQPGPHYGHFKRVREDGIAQTTQLSYPASWGAAAYDLVNHQQLTLTPQEDRCHLTLDLPPAGGAVIMILPRPIGAMTAKATSDQDTTTVDIHIADTAGERIPGILPIALTIREGNADRTVFRHVEGGQCSYTYLHPYDLKTPPVITIRNLANGQTRELP